MNWAHSHLWHSTTTINYLALSNKSKVTIEILVSYVTSKNALNLLLKKNLRINSLNQKPLFRQAVDGFQ